MMHELDFYSNSGQEHSHSLARNEESAAGRHRSRQTGKTGCTSRVCGAECECGSHTVTYNNSWDVLMVKPIYRDLAEESQELLSTC